MSAVFKLIIKKITTIIFNDVSSATIFFGGRGRNLSQDTNFSFQFSHTFKFNLNESKKWRTKRR